jgi:hypothetical protein
VREARAWFDEVLSIANQHLPEGVCPPIEVWPIENLTRPAVHIA